jgi:F-type H+-transporting ATPase subunit delta
MVSSTSMKYARALAEVAADAGLVREVKSDLESFQQTLDSNGELRQVLFSPSVPLAAKQGIVAGVARRLELSRIVTNFLFVVLERSRLHLLEEFSESYQEVLDDLHDVARVGVRSSHPLEMETQQRLKEVMSAVTGKTVRLSYEVDESLLGGIRLQVGSIVYDGTIRTRLEELRRQLAQGLS